MKLSRLWGQGLSQVSRKSGVWIGPAVFFGSPFGCPFSLPPAATMASLRPSLRHGGALAPRVSTRRCILARSVDPYANRTVYESGFTMPIHSEAQLQEFTGQEGKLVVTMCKSSHCRLVHVLLHSSHMHVSYPVPRTKSSPDQQCNSRKHDICI